MGLSIAGGQGRGQAQAKVHEDTIVDLPTLPVTHYNNDSPILRRKHCASWVSYLSICMAPVGDADTVQAPVRLAALS